MTISRVLTRSRAVLRLPLGLAHVRGADRDSEAGPLARSCVGSDLETHQGRVVQRRGFNDGGVFIYVARTSPAPAPWVRACRSDRSPPHNVWSVGASERSFWARASNRSARATRPRRTAPEIGAPLRRRCRVILEQRSRARCPIWRSRGAAKDLVRCPCDGEPVEELIGDALC